MIEKECKILEIDVDKVRQRLKEIKAKMVFSGKVNTQYLDFKDKKLKKENSVLRIRQIDGKIRLDLKTKSGKDEHHKICEEINVHIDDKENMLRIFSALGLKIIKEQEKYRESYKYKDILIEIDIIEGIPPFLEIEAESWKTIELGVELLGFKTEDAKPYTGSDVMKNYKR